MKTLLLLLFPIFMVGQDVKIPDRIIQPVDVMGMDELNKYVSENNVFQKTDTIRVIMLVCDTLILTPDVWWKFGYEVRTVEERNNVDGVLDPYFTFGFKPQYWKVYLHKEYLDQNKKPLPKSLVVWLHKEL